MTFCLLPQLRSSLNLEAMRSTLQLFVVAVEMSGIETQPTLRGTAQVTAGVQNGVPVELSSGDQAGVFQAEVRSHLLWPLCLSRTVAGH